ncbi:MAG: chemotaxis protein CheD [Candidatus Scalindua sp.]|nr:chemotaxis protein CheD [Candidatus Scalindua sp.]
MIHNNSDNIITVGVGDLKIANFPKTLQTSLGSCVGVVLYDNTKKTGGILHLMLPKCKNRNGRLSKYADTGIPLLIDLMVNKERVNRNFLTAKIFGGAKMFSVNSDMFDIGKSNIIETKIILEKMNIRIVAERTGGANGHQISLDTTTGIVQSRIFGHPTLKY